ncbi:unnamed protein product [Rotaria sordida]|uniref:Uncharacterized protein n=1 Tax=Rotaria sordida TaxID=392033 RepID=A0A818QFD7_9BILA|nr:unnamed protein product [Rotaria sordida]CAF3636464.1 unnamed protein product [Rotaria sordida]
MPFHICPSFTTKYSLLEYQKIHEYEYKKFLKTLQINKINSINISKEKLFKKNYQLYYNNNNNNYLFQRQINLQYRQNKRKILYEHIQKENLKFSQKLINAKTCLNRYEQKLFFDKHCKLKQQLQRYPVSIRIKTKKTNLQFSSNENFKIMNKPVNSSVFIYNNNNNNRLSHKSIKLQEKHSKMNNQIFITKNSLSNINKPQIIQEKLTHSIKTNSKFSKTLLPITSIIQNTKQTSNVTIPETNLLKNESSFTSSTDNIINWNISINTEDLKQQISSLKIQSSKTIYSSQSSSSESNLSNL